MLGDFEENAIIDRLEGWELVEFLQVSVEEVLIAARENGWINDENELELLDFVGIKHED